MVDKTTPPNNLITDIVLSIEFSLNMENVDISLLGVVVNSSIIELYLDEDVEGYHVFRILKISEPSISIPILNVGVFNVKTFLHCIVFPLDLKGEIVSIHNSDVQQLCGHISFEGPTLPTDNSASCVHIFDVTNRADKELRNKWTYHYRLLSDKVILSIQIKENIVVPIKHNRCGNSDIKPGTTLKSGKYLNIGGPDELSMTDKPMTCHVLYDSSVISSILTKFGIPINKINGTKNNITGTQLP